MEVKRTCKWCGKVFIAQKTTTKYCSLQCAQRGYKQRVREKRDEQKKNKELLRPIVALEGQDYLTFSKVANSMFQQLYEFSRGRILFGIWLFYA